MTALALALVLASPQLGCPAKTPPYDTWYVQRGYGAGDSVTAKRAAMEDARARLTAVLRDAYTEAQLAQLTKRINTAWVEPLYDTRRREACAMALLTKSAGDDTLRALSADLDAGLATLADTVAKRVKRRTVRLDAPTWVSGPDADRLGRRLAVRMQAPFAKHPKTRVVTRRGRYILGGDLTADGGRCRLQPWLQRGHSRTTLEPVVFDPKAVGLRDCTPPATPAIADAALGLKHGRRAGAGGLSVSLSASLRHGMLCGGTPYDLRVTTDRPADVRVYSVAEDGRVMGSWSRRVDGEWAVSPGAVAVRLPGGKRFRVVAVAVAPSTDFAGAPPLGCMTAAGTGLDPQRLPPGAALAAFTYGVWPPGTGDCPPDPEAATLHAKILTAIAAAPTCGAP